MGQPKITIVPKEKRTKRQTLVSDIFDRLICRVCFSGISDEDLNIMRSVIKAEMETQGYHGPAENDYCAEQDRFKFYYRFSK